MQNYFWWNYPGAVHNNPHLGQPQYPPTPTLPSPSQKNIEDLQEKYKRLSKENEELKKELKNFKDKDKKMIKRKIVRRTENQLNKNHQCPYPRCKKEYASGLALNLHIKNKHKGGNKKERDLLAEAIIKAQRQGRPIPQASIILPPNYVEKYKRERSELRRNQRDGDSSNASEVSVKEENDDQSFE